MKVMCIDDNWMKGQNPTTEGPKVCDICEVVGTKTFEGKLVYDIIGYWLYYEAENFIPLSDIDETEFIRNKKTELV